MAEDPAPNPISNLAANPDNANIRRPVYEPTLLPERKRLRLSRWVVIPGLLAVLGAALYVLLGAPHRRHVVNTANTIVYASDQGSPGVSHLWLANLDGSNVKRLTSAVATQPAFSPDGSSVAYLSPVNGTPQVFVVDADGQNLQQVTRNSGAKQEPSFAPTDSTLLAYLSGGIVSTANANTGDTDRLLPPVLDTTHPQSGDALINSPTIIIDMFAWRPAPDTDTLGMAAVESTSDVQALVLLPTLTAKPRDTQANGQSSVPLAAADDVSIAWPSDGRRLAVAMLGVKGLPKGKQLSALILLDPSGGSTGQHPLALTSSAALGPEHPVFSPDGSQVLFELWQQPDLARARCIGLYVVPADSSAPPHIAVKGDVSDPRWSRDGQSVLFLRPRPDGGHDLWRVGVNGDSLMRMSDGSSDISSFCISPQDGRGQ